MVMKNVKLGCCDSKVALIAYVVLSSPSAPPPIPPRGIVVSRRSRVQISMIAKSSSALGSTMVCKFEVQFLVGAVILQAIFSPERCEVL